MYHVSTDIAVATPVALACLYVTVLQELRQSNLQAEQSTQRLQQQLHAAHAAKEQLQHELTVERQLNEEMTAILEEVRNPGACSTEAHHTPL